MKILCVSDQIDPLIYSNNVKKRYKDIDLVLSCGDLPYSYNDFIMSALNKDLFYVHGNHDKIEKKPVNYGQPYHGKLIENKVIYLKKYDLIIAGLGGSMRYRPGEFQYTDKEMNRRIKSIAPKLLYNKIRYGRYLDILITHSSPLGIHDDIDLCHTGFSSFTYFMDVFSPKYLLHGHMHLTDMNQRPISTYKNTQIINVFQSFILEMKKDV